MVSIIAQKLVILLILLAPWQQDRAPTIRTTCPSQRTWFPLPCSASVRMLLKCKRCQRDGQQRGTLPGSPASGGGMQVHVRLMQQRQVHIAKQYTPLRCCLKAWHQVPLTSRPSVPNS